MNSVTPCPLCKEKQFTFVLTKLGRRIVRCSNDGLLMVNPLPTTGEIAEIYKSAYYDWADKNAKACTGYWAYIQEKPLLLAYFANKMKLLRRLGVTGTILDVGCGHGFFLEAARRAGMKAVGIDLSPQAVSYARKEGLTVYEKDIDMAPFQAKSFGAITGFQLIEHVTDPVTFLKTCYQLLVPGGTIMLSTPKANGYLHWLLGKHWLSYRHKEHLYFFSAKTLSAALGKAGFTNIRQEREDIRTYPLRHLLGGVKYYFAWQWFHKAADIAARILDRVGMLDVKVPLPLNTMVMTATKKNVT